MIAPADAVAEWPRPITIWQRAGSEQYLPRMMLALLNHRYAKGVPCSRTTQRATYRNVAVLPLASEMKLSKVAR